MSKFGSFMHPCQGQGWGILSVLFHKNFPCHGGFVSFWELTVDPKPIPFCVMGWGGSLLWSAHHGLYCSPWVMIKSTRRVTDLTLGHLVIQSSCIYLRTMLDIFGSIHSFSTLSFPAQNDYMMEAKLMFNQIKVILQGIWSP